MRPPRARRAAGGSPLGAVLGALVLAATAVLSLDPSASAQPAPLDWIKNGSFRDPLARGWNCDGEFVQTGQIVQGRPSGQNYAGCTQVVPVVPRTRYDFSAYMSGSYTFATVTGTGTGTGEVTLWADGPNWKSLAADLEIGDVREVTVTFHGWYGQGPFEVGRVWMIGPIYPNDCDPPTAAPGSPTPSASPCMPRPSGPPSASPSSPGGPTPPPPSGA